MRDLLDTVVKAIVPLAERRSLENPAWSLSNPPPWVWDQIGVQPGHSGVIVTPTHALALTAFWACVKIIAETVASLPLITYRQLDDDDKEKARDRMEYRILHDQFNPQMSAMIAREVAQVQLLVRGNGYFFIQFNKAMKPMALWPLRADKTYAIRKAGVLIYETTDTADGTMRVYDPEEILHVPGLSFDGLSGLSPVAVHRETIGHGLATERYGSAFFGQGQRPGGVLEHPGQMSDESYMRLKKSLSEQLSQPHQTMILEEGLKYNVISVPPEDAQYIETRRFNVADMARIFRMPLAMLEEHDKSAAYASVEQFFLQFVIHTVRPWLVRWEQEINRKIFGLTSDLFCEHNIDGLLRGDLKSRYDAYHMALQDGWMDKDEVRLKENMNRIPNGQGKVFFAPSNMTPLDRAIKPPAPAPAQAQQSPAAQPGGGESPPKPGSATRHGPNGHAIDEEGREQR